MFQALSQLPADPILGLMKLYREDLRAQKVDLGVGVYKDENSETPILKAVSQAQHALLASQPSKAYVGPQGNAAFNEGISHLLLGDLHNALADRFVTVQTPGGCGALRVAAELIQKTRPGASLWVSDPTWNNHVPLLGDAGLSIKTYPYYNADTQSLNREAFFDALENQVEAGDVVLLHACCHNPTGVDLTPGDWQQVAELALSKRFVPFIDSAYQGFGDGLDQDSAGMRAMLAKVPECILAYSCSKNFGLYRERVGAVAVLCEQPSQQSIVLSHILSIVRGIYSMPPDWGAAIVGKILDDTSLRQLWLDELAIMRSRIQSMRARFAVEMAERLSSDRFDFVKQQKGMFSFLGMTETEVAKLASDFGIYMLGSSRASISGMNEQNLAYVCQSIATVVADKNVHN